MFEAGVEGRLQSVGEALPLEPAPTLNGPELVWEPPACGPAWSEYQPSGMLMDVLAAQPAGEMDADQLIEAMTAWGRLTAFTQAMQSRALAAFARLRADERGEPFSEFAVDEVAPALGMSRQAAAARLSLAVALTSRLPATLATLECGGIDLAKARVVDEATRNLPAERAAVVESLVLPHAATQTFRQVQASAQRALNAVDPLGSERRHRSARKERRVVLTPVFDGMAELRALLPADRAVAIYRRVDAMARTGSQACDRGSDDRRADDRSADARRADAFTDLLLGQAAVVGRTGAEVHVTVPASTLLGLDDQPGELAGYGPIPASVARELSSDATWRRLLTDPISGAVLDYGCKTYRPPAALAGHVRARDRTCRFIGCLQPAARADLDHTIHYPEGPTSADNLGALCRHHHRLKHEGDWGVVQRDDGVFEWTSPTGRRYETRPTPAATMAPELTMAPGLMHPPEPEDRPPP